MSDRSSPPTPPPPGGDIHDIVVPPPPGPLWPIAAAVLGALAVAAALAWAARWWRRRQRSLRQAEPSPEVRAAQRLRELERLRESMDPNEFALALSDTLKDYLAERYRDPLRYETAQEFLARLARDDSRLPSAARAELQEFVLESEELKFGSPADGAERTGPLLDRAVSFLRLCRIVGQGGLPGEGPAGESPAPSRTPPTRKQP